MSKMKVRAELGSQPPMYHLSVWPSPMISDFEVFSDLVMLELQFP